MHINNHLSQQHVLSWICSLFIWYNFFFFVADFFFGFCVLVSLIIELYLELTRLRIVYIFSSIISQNCSIPSLLLQETS